MRLWLKVARGPGEVSRQSVEVEHQPGKVERQSGKVEHQPGEVERQQAKLERHSPRTRASPSRRKFKMMESVCRFHPHLF